MTTRSDTHTTTRISIRGLEKRYDDVVVFQGIDLDVGDREVLSIVGPSGCGKTTLLRCLNGLLDVDAGQILIDGEPVMRPRPTVATVFQDFGLFPWKNVLDNVAYAVNVRGTPRKEARDRARPFIELVGLTGFERSYPHQLSGGMQQRCGLARALMIEPSVLLMDEPFGALDAQTRELLQFEMLRIWAANPTTMVFVTHSIDEAVLMGDRIVVLGTRGHGIREIIDVDIPRPRDRDALTTPEFDAIRQHVWELVMDETIAETPDDLRH